ncbi:DUF2029 domain-containing protein [bacterium]|nr:DUF2029 domain-containing protein [bacterium]
MGIGSVFLVLLCISNASPDVDAARASDETHHSARFGDMAAYWVAGRAVLEYENPFDPDVVQRIEEHEGLHQAFVIWNPPWILPIVALIGLLPFTMAAIAWCAANVAMAIASGLALRKKTGLSPFATVVATITFVPILFCVGMSQWSILVLAAVLGYDSLRQDKRPFLAGVILAFAAVKPHLVALVWLIPLLTGSKRDRLLTLGGTLFTLISLLGITYLWEPRLIPDYFRGLRHPAPNAPTNYLAATSAVWMKVATEHWLGIPFPGIQFLPLMLALLGTAIWLANHPRRGAEEIPVLLLGSALFLPYGWHYDQVLLLPCYLLLWGEVARTSCRYRRMRLALILILLNGGMGLMAFLGSDASLYFVWPPVLGLVWFLKYPFRQQDQSKLAFTI